MTVRSSSAEWQGTIRDGRGHVRLGSGAIEAPYSFNSRFGDGGGTNPEELLGAAHAGCFTMALAVAISQAGFTVIDLRTTASVHFDRVNDVPTITQIDLTVGAEVPGMDQATFAKLAEGAKAGCPVSRALAATKITLDATLKA